MALGEDSLEVRLYDTDFEEDVLLEECGLYSRFYGFVDCGKGDIAIPHLDEILFGFQNPLAGL